MMLLLAHNVTHFFCADVLIALILHMMELSEAGNFLQKAQWGIGLDGDEHRQAGFQNLAL